MRISAIDLPLDVAKEFDLRAIKMDKLKQVVLLAGKNGAGKTRFLNALRNCWNETLTIDEHAKSTSAAEVFSNGLEKLYENQRALRDYLLQTPNSVDTQKRLKTAEENIQSYETSLQFHQDRLQKSSYLNFNTGKDLKHKIVEFVPKDLRLQDSFELSPQRVSEAAGKIFKIGITEVYKSALPAIQLAQDQWASTQLPPDDLSITPDEIENIRLRYDRLKSYIRTFLGTDLKRNAQGAATLFDKRIGEAQLSDGQKVLLQFCIALFAQGISLGKAIIVMDEPENHLHPAALMEVLDRIVMSIPDGQLWIATHSVNVLSHFDSSCIWFIEDGEISYAGNVPEKVLKSLLGDDSEMEKLSSFLSLPAKMASEKFAYECLFYPDVVMTGSGDPQTTQIHNIIKKRVEDGKPIKVLDFGMGKGRLISSIYENERLQGNDIKGWMDYYGFDAYNTHKEDCESLLNSIYGNGGRYFNKETDALACLHPGTFDFVVMCNTLHEIDPENWLDVFTSGNSLITLLKTDGYLLVVEDQFLAVGEKAHSKGFLVLDTLELKRLFDIKSAPDIQTSDYRGDGRLKAHLIPAEHIHKMTKATRDHAIQTLADSAKKEIIELRKSSDISFKNGKLHSFWAQQLANASIALM
jgi:ABC-type multidrug transport system ATPase subunit